MMDRRLVSAASLSRSSRLGCSVNCKVSHIVVSSSRPKVSLSRICCRGQGHQHAFCAYNLQQKIQNCRNRYHAVCVKMRDAASTDDGSRSSEIRSRDGGFNGASIHNSFNRLEADITEVTYSQTSLANPRFQLALIRESDIRSKLVRKLSEANQQIRQLKKEVQEKDDKMFRCRSELASMELELQVLVNIAQEIAKEGGKPGTPKINGRYIHSHLAYRLEEMQKLIFARIKDVDMVRTREVDIAYYGMAEDVRVMGSFDGWTYGEQMSPESTSMYTRFTSTIKLRPGRYEIKFLVDGEWQLSSELPMSGEGVTMNNLLIVD
ncbi:unnamed protein product [Sphagnum jensenii]|uniref:AMP-activated protein kinase glycogen-binding domain-containing protein n=1 Tax=Sphagnum jensenii TaxID=128206 RepID=A0ABP0WQ31_9BRYO